MTDATTTRRGPGTPAGTPAAEAAAAVPREWTKPENWNGDDYIGDGLPPWGTRPRCSAVRNGRRCKKAVIPGGTVCNTHGGASPQVKRRAQLRLLSLIDPAISSLARTLATTADEKLRVQVAFGLLDRTGLGKATDVSADVAKAVLMDRYYALREKVEEERANAGMPEIEAEWAVVEAAGAEVDEVTVEPEPDEAPSAPQEAQRPATPRVSRNAVFCRQSDTCVLYEGHEGECEAADD